MTAARADWSAIRLRPGDWTCPIHGLITPADDGLVPYCPVDVDGRTCSRVALHAELRRGRLVHVEPRPERCPAGHPLGPRTVLLGWDGCQCTPAGGHRLWTCQTCPRGTPPLAWPPAH